MLKTYMIEKISEEVISDNVGRMTFYLIDENGDCRTVNGETFLDKDQNPTGISSESKRELPLVESLFSNRDKKVVDIDFEKYNMVYDRDLDKTINEIAFEKVKEMEKEKTLSYRLAKLFGRTKLDSQTTIQE